jgi:hypothetical protein
MGRIRCSKTEEIRKYLMEIKNICLGCGIKVTEMWRTFFKNKKDRGILIDTFNKTLGG